MFYLIACRFSLVHFILVFLVCFPMICVKRILIVITPIPHSTVISISGTFVVDTTRSGVDSLCWGSSCCLCWSILWSILCLWRPASYTGTRYGSRTLPAQIPWQRNDKNLKANKNVPYCDGGVESEVTYMILVSLCKLDSRFLAFSDFKTLLRCQKHQLGINITYLSIQWSLIGLSKWKIQVWIWMSFHSIHIFFSNTDNQFKISMK